MSEHYLRTRKINYQDTTPKRLIVNPNQSYTQPYLNQSPIYHTPDRAMKQPFRNQNQSYNDMSDFNRRQISQYPPTYQSSQISIQQEFNNTSTSKQFEQIIKRSDNSISQESSWFQQNMNISPNTQQQRIDRDKNKRDTSQPFYDTVVRITNFFKHITIIVKLSKYQNCLHLQKVLLKNNLLKKIIKYN